jgi:hypothetical protein
MRTTPPSIDQGLISLRFFRVERVAATLDCCGAARIGVRTGDRLDIPDKATALAVAFVTQARAFGGRRRLSQRGTIARYCGSADRAAPVAGYRGCPRCGGSRASRWGPSAATPPNPHLAGADSLGLAAVRQKKCRRATGPGWSGRGEDVKQFGMVLADVVDRKVAAFRRLERNRSGGTGIGRRALNPS